MDLLKVLDYKLHCKKKDKMCCIVTLLHNLMM